MNVQSPRRHDFGLPPDGSDVRPLVAPPNAGLPGIAIAGIAALLAILLFIVLNNHRQRATVNGPITEQAQTGTFAAPPPLVIPPETPPVLEPSPVVAIPVETVPVRQPRTPPPAIGPVYIAPTPSPQVRSIEGPLAIPPKLDEPALIYDFGATAGPARPMGQTSADAPPAAAPPPAVRPPGRPSLILGQPPARPTRIANPGTVVPAGTLIKAVLETPIDTARPGLARAVVSADARSFDGQRVLVPKGSRLIGEYDADVRAGQRKVLINWTQLVRPDGSMIRLDSPAADAMGGSGLSGQVHSYFFQRFFNSVLQSALTLGGSVATWSNDAPVVIGLPTGGLNPVSNLAGQGGLNGQTPQPKITVKQGALFNVFVARDLDFSGAPGARSSRR